MSELHVVIPTYRRPLRQITLNFLPKKWQKQTTLVVDPVDAALLKSYKEKGVELLVHPPHVTSIAKKRRWILEHYGATAVQKIIMFDDDLRFARRHFEPNGSFSLVKATDDDIDWALNKVSMALDDFVHVGISPRQGNNGITSARRWYKNSRMIYALGYRVQDVVKNCILGRIEHREDMELCLQLLTKGFPNRVLLEMTVDQVYNSKGGASAERSVTASNEDAVKLQQMFPDFVKVVEREYKVSVPRKEVVVAWKKAYEQGRILRRKNRDR